MMPNFQCPLCSNYNAIGDPACKVCGERFIYNCPVCSAPVDNRYSHCPNCGDILYWGIVQQQAIAQVSSDVVPDLDKKEEKRKSRQISQADETAQARTRSGKSLLWILLIVISILLIAAMLFIDRIINK